LDVKINGKQVPVIVGFTPMRDSSQNVFGVIINVRDRAEMEKFYQHLRNADRLATMGTFASGLAHEIRNPLGAIKGTAQLLQEDLGPNHSASEYLQIITKEVNRLDTLVREVQAYSQPASDKAPADIGRLLEEIIKLAKADERFSSRDFKLETDIQPLPREVASKHQLRQALLNILLNAFDAVPDGGAVRVTAEVSSQPNRPVRITIANQGEAIPADIQAKIFEPFFTTKSTGTGLGLPIAAQVAANHGGRLSVECCDGWTRFIMLLNTESTTPSAGLGGEKS
jgi:signal transduction histidine kinase